MIWDSQVVKDNKYIKSEELMLIAGPCAVESYNQLYEVAKCIKKNGGKFLRGGAYKPRTSPYSFQGLGTEGLKILNEIGRITSLKTVTELTSEKKLSEVMKYCDIIQIGSRNMQNFELLKLVGKEKIPVILKRGMSNTIKEWLYAAEYILSQGNYSVVLCERGIKTFETATRNTLDISSIAVAKDLSFLPIIVDPSHACGNRKYIKSLSLASVAAGADGLMLEVHADPQSAKSDKEQQIDLAEYESLVSDIRKIARTVNKKL